MKKSSLAILAASLLSAAMSANAGIVNFDMSVLSPVPAFDSVTLDLDANINPRGMGIECAVFGDLNRGGGLISGCTGALYGPVTFTNADIVDGVFSLSLQITGAQQTRVPFVYGTKDGIRTAKLYLDGTVEATIPEPATMALVGLGLAAIGWSRMGRRQNRGTAQS